MAGGLQLGPVLFEAFEVPERLRFGGKQIVAVHVLPGGGRVVDALGADEGPVSWTGVFSGPLASDRAVLLDGMRRAGAALPLSWSGSRYTVIIERFEAVAMNPAWIPYQISACVVAVGDPVSSEPLPEPATVMQAGALGVGSPGFGVDELINAASNGLASADIGAAILASGTLARLVTGRALLVAAGGIAT